MIVLKVPVQHQKTAVNVYYILLYIHVGVVMVMNNIVCLQYCIYVFHHNFLIWQCYAYFATASLFGSVLLRQDPSGPAAKRKSKRGIDKKKAAFILCFLLENLL